MDRETLRELRDHQLAFLRRWLDDASDRGARRLWIEQGCAAIERVRMLPIERLVARADLDRVLLAISSEALAAGVFGPLVGWVTAELATPFAELELSAAELIGEQARRAVEAIAERPDVIDEAMVRAIAREPAMEAVMRDVLFDALVAFNDRTNPFVAPWGVPALVDALPRVGRGAIRKTFDTVRGEFERRLQPEMRRFLEGFSRKSLDQMIDLFVDKAAEPELVALRRHAAGVVLDAPINELAWPQGDARHEALREAIRHGLAHALAHERIGAMAGALLDDWWGRYASRPVADVLAELEIEPPDPEPFVCAAWPTVQALVSDDTVFAQIAELLDRSHEDWLASR